MNDVLIDVALVFLGLLIGLIALVVNKKVLTTQF
jgi:hypothetical protein